MPPDNGPKARDAAWLLLVFFAPLLAAALWLQHLGWPIALRSLPYPHLVRHCAPYLLGASLAAPLIILAAALAVFIATPARWKAACLAFFALAYLAATLGLTAALLTALAASGLWMTLRLSRMGRRAAPLLLVISCLPLAALVASSPREMAAAAWGLCVSLLLGCYSTWRDAAAEPELPDFLGCLVFWVGLPANYFIFLYRHSDWSASFLRRPYRETARRGVEAVFLGLALIGALTVVQTALYPYLGPLVRSVSAREVLSPGLAPAQRWLWGAGYALVFVVQQAACVLLAQGVTSLFGYDVPPYMEKPFAAWSPRRLWKNLSRTNYDYNITYVFMPCYLATRSVYVSLMACWALTAALNFGGSYMGVLWAPAAGLSAVASYTLLRYALFGHAVYAETRLEAASRRSLRDVPFGYQAAVLLLTLAMLTLTSELRASPLSSLEHTLHTILRMLTLRQP